MDEAQLVGMLVGSIAMGIVTQIVGDRRGRKFGFIWGFLLGLIGLIILLCLGKKDEETNENKYDNIEKLNQLKESGAITPEEYEEEKKKLLK